MRMLIFILCVFSLGEIAAQADVPENWSTNYGATLATAATRQEPTLIYFTASWCEPCKLMTRMTLTHPATDAAFTNIQRVALDIDENRELANKWGVSAVPTLIMVAETGDEVDRTTGFRPITDFLPWLTNAVTAADVVAAKQEEAQKTLAQTDQWLALGEANSEQLAAMKLFDLCALRDDKMVQAAAARLKNLARREPEVVLAGLNDPRLSVRIEAANVLRGAIGESFDIDPWEDAAIRAKSVDTWKLKLAKASGGEGH